MKRFLPLLALGALVMASAIPASAQAQKPATQLIYEGERPASHVELDQTGTQVLRGGDEVVLTQSDFDEVDTGGVACALSSWTPPYTTTNSFWRMFDLSEVPGITDGFEITSADVGIGQSNYYEEPDAWPIQTAGLRFYIVPGDLSIFDIVLVDTVGIEMTPDIAMSVVNVPVSGVNIPAGSKLAVELYFPQCYAEDPADPENNLIGGCAFRAGHNPFGQTAPTYIYSYGACGIADITDMADIGFPDNHWVLTLTGINSSGTATEEGALPAGVSLDLYPNPANSTARLALQLDTPEFVTVEVYDVAGRQVATLHNGPAAGQLDLELDRSAFSNGVYLVHLRGESFSATRKFVVLN